MAKYDDKDWKDLPEEAKEAAKKLGYNKKMWNGDKEPDACDEYWDDLDEDQRQAAMVLGYDKESWDKEGMFGKCCVIL
eukprot:CAMPEP_0201689182 /NCGR_PEP_ID=MMETSP0578-20130828/2805_1 /ASSEMBLY_ACC=CAM_ASM_000663 /TAXON_ID=267565 /ORGANISM="Skeletonema grethea, Strain CCMP 1804" /LENGTH=77 /DNA_ID=CAMNT_0048173735 /DNA_START=54 /DNA_END=287 /DNA_ORIENTATION=-